MQYYSYQTYVSLAITLLPTAAWIATSYNCLKEGRPVEEFQSNSNTWLVVCVQLAHLWMVFLSLIHKRLPIVYAWLLCTTTAKASTGEPFNRMSSCRWTKRQTSIYTHSMHHHQLTVTVDRSVDVCMHLYIL